jgi:uncharacterized membrane protein (DUF2068 family)
MQRPTGITILGIVFLILGGLSFLWSLLVFGFGGVSSLFSSLFTFSINVSSSFWSGMLGMVTAAVQFATGFGLLRMSRWAWYLALIGAGLTLIQGVTGMFAGGFVTFVCAGIGLIIPVIIFFYLLRPQIRAMFGIGEKY